MVSDLQSITADADGRISKIVINFLVIDQNGFREGSLDIAGYFTGGKMTSTKVVATGTNEYQKRKFLADAREFINDTFWNEYQRLNGNPDAIVGQEPYGVEVEMPSTRRGACRCNSAKRTTRRK